MTILSYINKTLIIGVSIIFVVFFQNCSKKINDSVISADNLADTEVPRFLDPIEDSSSSSLKIAASNNFKTLSAMSGISLLTYQSLPQNTPSNLAVIYNESYSVSNLMSGIDVWSCISEKLIRDGRAKLDGQHNVFKFPLSIQGHEIPILIKLNGTKGENKVPNLKMRVCTSGTQTMAMTTHEVNGQTKATVKNKTDGHFWDVDLIGRYSQRKWKEKLIYSQSHFQNSSNSSIGHKYIKFEIGKNYWSYASSDEGFRSMAAQTVESCQTIGYRDFAIFNIYGTTPETYSLGAGSGRTEEYCADNTGIERAAAQSWGDDASPSQTSEHLAAVNQYNLSSIIKPTVIIDNFADDEVWDCNISSNDKIIEFQDSIEFSKSFSECLPSSMQ